MSFKKLALGLLTFVSTNKVELLLFLFSTFVYWKFRWPTGHLDCENLASTNDGAILSETRSLYLNQTFDISQNRICTEGDVAKVGDKQYSNKSMGVSIAAIPFYALGEIYTKLVAIPNNRIMALQAGFNTRIDMQSPESLHTYAWRFQPKSSTIEKITMRIGKMGEPVNNLYVSVAEDVKGIPGDGTVGQSRIIYSQQLKQFASEITFEYKGNLDINKKYWVLVGPTNKVVSPTGYYYLLGAGDTENAISRNSLTDVWAKADKTPYLKIFSSTDVPANEGIYRYLGREVPIRFSSLLSLISAGLSVSLLNMILTRLLGVSRGAGFLTALIMAFGTLIWRYSTVVFVHAFSIMLMLVATYLFLAVKLKRLDSLKIRLLLGIVLGAILVTEYRNLFYVFLVLLSLLSPRELVSHFKKRFRYIMPVGFGMLPFLLFILVFNYSAFGSPFATAFKYYKDYPMFLSESSIFTKNHLFNTIVLFFGGTVFPDSVAGGTTYLSSQEVYGVLYMAPYLLFSLVGFYFMRRQYYNIASLIVFIFVASSAFLTFTTSSFGGGSHDYRYLLDSVVLLFMPLAFYVDRLLKNDFAKITSVVQLILFLALVTFSWYMHYSLTTGMVASSPVLDWFNVRVWPWFLKI
ncbi:hypothetical protein A3K34_02365 [candidate division WWE3 bacterium RIFOXYC1_FULL_40_10]|uniref:Glycosyltransferase RgtA/B/C/D-like domain-containing protein n=1 Tax=candidate division WWE3 bacterium RIFOXYA2_FULL_46_9 TaxID=1802636 RepID=A0A1F4VYR6_UNCKA|nr:MAG: hypothetical protein A3K58_02365 [candidate division WWE3 bacterium RIFOXYB1_FULL_40_22]OGC61696.1 MAG: hypothetical protein A3K37_02365 [candidate division WWE3 bacterium RIFOXYA1_FULL_40_11]OGC62319.1 MAG: hypothetical protein A2264_02005 [candidate division WWE3 bacterium RIFOXYA2_FULL_46_9]OGC64871.1 MAG: hypothetical protein A2326_01190 [candidate division WWE3 bacterium RIFOXYB2_FULL_41_6]OGC66079.1 MAG: hypothetical protein A3K34_02365 [candidate division WWE3 bacterium RIFOXYC1_